MFEYIIGLVFKESPPKQVVMYHMTTRESAIKIMQGGFDPRKARSKAFGEGINVSSKMKEVLQYAPKDDVPCIIFCMVTYHRAIPNDSDCKQMIHEVSKDGNEAWFSKPKYMHPPPGYDALCYDDIYVFPLSEQVIPMFMVSCQSLLKNN